MSVRKKFRELLNRPEILVIPGAYDAFSARIIAQQGFEAVGCGGVVTTASLLGEADLSQVTMREYADHYARICGAVPELPVFVDGDTGFGGVNNVRHTMRAFENAGVAGFLIEDQVFPKRCGYIPGKEVVPIENMLAKIKAALDARRDPDLVLMARTDAMGVVGLDAAIERAQLFHEAGADMTYVQGADKIEDYRRVCREVPGLQFGNLSQSSGKIGFSVAEIEAAGGAAVMFPSAAMFAAGRAMQRAMASLRRDLSVTAFKDELMTLPEFYEVVGLDETLKREESYDVAANALMT